MYVAKKFSMTEQSYSMKGSLNELNLGDPMELVCKNIF